MTDLWKDLIVILFFLTLPSVVTCDNYQVVDTNSGLVKGIFSQHDKGIIYKFLKIPFAKPPMGNLRFSKPEPIDPWNDVIDATDYPPSCIQEMDFFGKYLPTLEESEDCLFLSVYVPNEVSAANKKAVMVWIHGGGYYIGQSSMYDGSHLALTGDVIVVTLNYRLNVFGFFSTWDSTAPGNDGLWDQILALQWVKDNIERFGGNPESVTIFGESAGGFSVSLLSLMPRNKGLFHRVIAQSGTAISPMAYNEKNKSYMQAFLEDVGCSGGQSDSSLIVECLRQVPAEKLLNSSFKSFMDGMNNDMILPFSPRIDNVLLNDEPASLLKDSESQSRQFMQSLDYMAGFTDKEGIGVLVVGPEMFPDDSFNATEGISTKFLCQTFARKLSITHYNDRSEIIDAICKMYSVDNGDTTNKIEQAKRVVDCFGDFSFGGACIGSLNEHIKTDKSRQYRYVFSRPFDSFLAYKVPDWFDGAPHGAELPYLFGVKQMAELFNVTVTDEDDRLADVMMKYWTNFAKSGNPNEPNSESLPKWPVYTSEEMDFMNLNFESKPETASIDFKNRMNLWVNYTTSVVGKTPYH